MKIDVMQKIKDLKEYQDIVFDLLVKFDEICTHYGLKYSLVGGSLLGAVRYNDFIPWDDDCDVCLSRSDYEILLSHQDEIESSFENYKFLSCRTNKIYAYPFCKLYRKDTFVADKDYKPVVYGAYIDIFPIDGAPEDKIVREKVARKIRFLSSCAEITTWNQVKSFTLLERCIFRIETFFPRIFYKQLRRIFPKRAEQEAAKYQIEDYPYCGCLVWGYGWEKEIMPKEVFFPFDKKILFHGKLFSCLSQPEVYLKNIYGEDFMTPPPKEKQVCHELDVYYLEQGDSIK